jgi:hypothetical protein
MIRDLLGNLHLPSANAMLLLLLGGSLCFAGWKLFNTFRRIYGALIAAALGLSLAPRDHTALRVVCTALAGISGFYLGHAVYAALLFITGAGGAGLVTAIVLLQLDVDPILVDFATAVAFIAGGSLALVAPDWPMMLITGAVGSLLTTISIHAFSRGARTGGPAEINFVFLVGLACVGIVSQLVIHFLTHGKMVVSKSETTSDKPLGPPPNRPAGPFNPGR